MEITIENLQKRLSLYPSQIIKATKSILHHEGVKKASLSIVFVNDRKIKSLNQKYRRHHYPTDVLAFDLREDRRGVRQSKRSTRRASEIIGEIVISTDTVFKNSKTFKTAPREELYLCVIHGILHLLGHDDHGAQNIKRMRQKEHELLHFLAP